MSNAARVLNIIESAPGIHFRGIAQLLAIPIGTLDYTLFRLQKNHAIIAETVLQKKRYFTPDIIPAERKIIGVLRERSSRAMVRALLEGQQSHAQILAQCAISKSTVSWHLARLANEGIIVKRASRYALANPTLVRRLNAAYRETRLDRITSNFSDLW